MADIISDFNDLKFYLLKILNAFCGNKDKAVNIFREICSFAALRVKLHVHLEFWQFPLGQPRLYISRLMLSMRFCMFLYLSGQIGPGTVVLRY
jgi:hypothetical protein